MELPATTIQCHFPPSPGPSQGKPSGITRRSGQGMASGCSEIARSRGLNAAAGGTCASGKRFFSRAGWWKHTFMNERGSLGNSPGTVHSKDHDGCPPSGRPAEEHWAIPPKVPVPALQTGIEERGYPPGQRINARQVCSLVVVIKKTSQCQILGDCPAAMTFGNDVVDLKGKQVLFLRELTILAARLCPCPDLLNEATLHALRAGAVPLAFLECKASPRFHDRDKAANVAIRLDFLVLFRRQYAFSGLVG
jgi:hypothetical protein